MTVKKIEPMGQYNQNLHKKILVCTDNIDFLIKTFAQIHIGLKRIELVPIKYWNDDFFPIALWPFSSKLSHIF